MLELLVGTIALAGVIAIALERPPAPRPIPVWSDEVERRLAQRPRERW